MKINGVDVRRIFIGPNGFDGCCWEIIIDDPDVALEHIESSCKQDKPQPFLQVDDHYLIIGPGPTASGLRYSFASLEHLRDKRLVTSWKGLNDKDGNRLKSRVTSWWWGDVPFSGPGILNGKEKDFITLYKTNEQHSGGHDVYRRVGVKPQIGKYGRIGGEYFVDVGSGEYMQLCTVGKAYKDEYGLFDGEPCSPIEIDIVII